MTATANLESELRQFTGTENYYRTMLARMVYTDGVKYLAEQAHCYWLIDAIASHQMSKRIYHNERLQQIQFWTLTVKDGKGVLAVVEDNGCKPVLTQRIPFTDFPLPEIKLYLVDGVLMLPSEY